MPTAWTLYDIAVAREDRAPLGSDLSALAMPYGIGRGPTSASSFICAGGSNAINPGRGAAACVNFAEGLIVGKEI